MTQTEAIRGALRELGTEAPREQVEKWVKAKGLSLTVSFGVILSQERKRLRGDTAVESWADVPDGPDPLPGCGPRPYRSPVAILHELRKLVGEPAEFKVQLDRVQRAVELAGSFTELREFLDFLGS